MCSVLYDITVEPLCKDTPEIYYYDRGHLPNQSTVIGPIMTTMSSLFQLTLGQIKNSQIQSFQGLHYTVSSLYTQHSHQ